MVFLSPLFIDDMALPKLYILSCPSWPCGIGFDDCRRFSTMSDAIAAAEILCAYLREPVDIYLCRSISKPTQKVGQVSIFHNRPLFRSAEPNNSYFVRSVSAFV